MARVFQQFVRTFYDLEQDEFHVSSERLSWAASTDNPGDLQYLPTMVTDVTMRSLTRCIVIECKYYRSTLQQQFSKSSLHSENVYQLFAYLKNTPAKTSMGNVEGILLYPRVGGKLNIRVTLQKHLVKVCTIDLSQKWIGVHKDLLDIIN